MLTPDKARSVAQSLVERGIAAGASAADALYVGDRSSSVQVRLKEIDSVSRSEGEEIGLRLFVGQRSATVASSDLSDEALAALVERCLAMAREAPEDRYAGLAFWMTVTKGWFDNQGAAVET
jgi:PmbA protein